MEQTAVSRLNLEERIFPKRPHKLAKRHVSWDDNCKKEYMFRAFPGVVVCCLLDVLANNEDVVSVVLNYLPDENVRMLKRRINRIFRRPRDMFAYWRLESVRPNIFGHGVPKAEFTIQVHSRKFITQWFRMLIKLEQSLRARNIFDVIIELVKRRENRMIVVTDMYIMVDDKVFDIDFPRSISLFV